MVGGRAVKASPLIFVFRMASCVHRGSGQARLFSMYPRRWWLSLSSRAKAFTLQRRHRRFVGDSTFHTSFRGAPLLVGDTAKKVVLPSATSTEFDATQLHTIIVYCTGYVMLYSSLYLLITVVLIQFLVQVQQQFPILLTETVSACSCHSQRFEKSLIRTSTRCLIYIYNSRPSKYCSSPSEPLIASGASLKVVEFWRPANHNNIGAASDVCSSVHVVYKTY